jgi:UDP-hydrolysing UDP-N-acetyl-D-glucosamine 2-epimerase
MKNIRTIMVYLSSRANYSSYKPLMTIIKSYNSLRLITVISGSALIDKYGNLEDIVVKDGFKVDYRIHSILEGSNLASMTASVSVGIQTFNVIIENEKPDILLLVGDRYEVLSASIVGITNNIFVAHTMGGELSGTVDDKIRHAITKMANIHFPATDLSAKRIVKMGENPDFVFNYGCPRMDYVKRVLEENKVVGYEIYNTEKGVGDLIDLSKEFILISQHPVTTEYGNAEKQMNNTLEAASSFGIPLIILWPNSDAGSDDISRSIRKFRESNVNIELHLFKNLSIDNYIRLMKQACCLVGNSSSGLREGAFIGVPVVNIGTRQRSREFGRNVINVGYETDEIKFGIRSQFGKKYTKDFMYGDGNASKRIIGTLAICNLETEKSFYES